MSKRRNSKNPVSEGMSFSLSSLFGDPLLDDEKDDDSITGDSYSWSVDDYGFEFSMICFCIQNAVKELDKNCYILQSGGSGDFEYDLNKNKSVLTTGIITFNYRKKNFALTFNVKSSTVTLSGNGKIDELREIFDDYIKNKNPLRRKNIQIYSRHGDLKIAFHPVPDLPYEKLIVEESIKEDIYDNTILQLEKLDSNNGVIFYGEPGLGKTSCAKSLIHEAIKKGYSSCTVTSNVGFTTLGQFIKAYIAPAIILFEDVDSYCTTRDEKDNPELADFLQLLSGISDDKDKIIYIASTNHINLLDKAISDRPCRFNRRYNFTYPNPGDVSKIIDLYFGQNTIPDKEKESCYNCKFGGSHIKELKRTCDILCLKNNKSLAENWTEAVAIVKNSFAIPKGPMGFKGFAQALTK